jgi:hypothetical protein
LARVPALAKTDSFLPANLFHVRFLTVPQRFVRLLCGTDKDSTSFELHSHHTHRWPPFCAMIPTILANYAINAWHHDVRSCVVSLRIDLVGAIVECSKSPGWRTCL